ncbi:uncharacterized protein METZ01_LOCUS418014, partial [marine metagenome]
MAYKLKLIQFLNRTFLPLTLVAFSHVFGQTVAFTPAGQASGFSKYNLTVSTANGTDGAGGFSMAGTNFAAATRYLIKISFDGGTNWYEIANATATSGTWQGDGLFKTTDAQTFQIAWSHSRMADELAAWPGAVNTGTINLRISNIAESVHYPSSTGAAFVLDLVQPSINTSVISSNNSTNNAYATTGNQITVTFTTSEDLDNSDNPIVGTISGVSASVTGSAQSWTVYNIISTHADGTAT